MKRHDQRQAHDVHHSNNASPIAPGRTSRTAASYAHVTPSSSRSASPTPIQFRQADSTGVAGHDTARDPFDYSGMDIATIAADGVSSAAAPLPHLATIQRAFGRHDVTGVRTSQDARAQRANTAMGARAYASGNTIAFAEMPDVFLAAHEAAHVVQQRKGVSLKGEIGQTNDVYEQHADRVASLVVAGKSAEATLDEMVGASPTPAVQRNAADDSQAVVEPPGECEVEPGETQNKSKLELLIDDINAGFKTVLSAAIEAAAPEPGTELELSVTARCPTGIPAVWLSGLMKIKISRETTGFTASLGGGLGVAVGGAGAFADFLGTASIQAEGATGERVVDMLNFAVEMYMRTIPDGIYLAPLARSPLLAIALSQAAAAAGTTIGDLFADWMWGKGHDQAVMEAMQDGEAAQISGGGMIGGSAGDGNAGVKGKIELTEALRIEKQAGQEVSKSTATNLQIKGEVAVGPVGAEMDLQFPMPANGEGKVAVNLKGPFHVDDMGSASFLVSALTTSLNQLQGHLAEESVMAADKNGALAELCARQQEVEGVFQQTIEQMVVADLRNLGIAQGSIEASFELDAKTGTLTLTIFVVNEVEVPIDPVSGSKGSITQKSKLFPTIVLYSGA